MIIILKSGEVIFCSRMYQITSSSVWVYLGKDLIQTLESINIKFIVTEQEYHDWYLPHCPKD